MVGLKKNTFLASIFLIFLLNCLTLWQKEEKLTINKILTSKYGVQHPLVGQLYNTYLD